MDGQHWWVRLIDVFAYALKREVKTPLSFFFLLVWAIAGIVIAGMLTLSRSDAGDSLRADLFYVGMAVLLLMFLVVCGAALFRPKNLVYGETGHRPNSR